MGDGGKGTGGKEGGRRPTGFPPEREEWTGALPPKGRWSVSRKRGVVLRLLRGESLDLVSRETGVEIYRLEKWFNRALSGIDESLREREGDPVQGELDAAMKRLGEISMENELLWKRIREKTGPLPKRRSSK